MSTAADMASELPSLQIPAIAELAGINQWVGYRALDKVPLQPSGAAAKSNDPETWSSFQEVAQAYVDDVVDGLGFTFSAEDDIVGVDFDDCLDASGQITDPWVEDCVRKLDSYTEISPSGDGLHVLLKGSIPRSVKMKVIEIYDQGRYFTVTGRHFPDTPTTLEWRDEQLKALYEELGRTKEAPPPGDGNTGRYRPGERHEAILSRGRGLRKRGLSEPELRGALHAFNSSYCEEPKSKSEVDEIVRWVIENIDPPATKPGRKFEFLSFAEIKADLQSRGLIKGLIERGSMVVMYGASNSSKTFIALDMGLCVASGRRWHGRKVEHGMVVYVAAEGARGVSKRVDAYRQEILKNAANVRFHLLPTTVNFLDGEGDVEPLTEAIRDLERKTGHLCVLVIIDTLSRAMDGGNENASEDMTALIANSDRVRRALDCALVWVHHTGKDEARGARGHSSLRAATDTELEVSERGNLCFHVRATKQRELDGAAAHSYTLRVVELGVDEDGELVTTCVVEPGDKEASGSAPGKTPQLTDAARNVRRAMEDLFQDRQDVTLPDEVKEAPGVRVMPGQTALRLSVLRDHALRAKAEPDTRSDKASDTKSDTLSRSFRRGLERLQACGMVRVMDDFVWFER